jgi:myo-inositol 2-dehydrogenase/D-chiro-inositol 1-dehydrogenase
MLLSAARLPLLFNAPRSPGRSCTKAFTTSKEEIRTTNRITTILLFVGPGVWLPVDDSCQDVYGYDQRIEVFGSGGMVSADNKKPDSHVYCNAEGVSSAKPLYFFLERYTQSFVDEMCEFVASIQNDVPPPVTGLDGRIPVLMGKAAKKSWEENRPVKLSEIG